MLASPAVAAPAKPPPKRRLGRSRNRSRSPRSGSASIPSRSP